VHFEWLHDSWGARLRGQMDGPAPPTHLKVRFEEFDYGFKYQRVREGQSEDDELWTVGRVCLWPNCLFTGNHFEWRVPLDDATTLSVGWFFDRVPEEMEPFRQERIPWWYGPLKDPASGRWLDSHVMNQDFVAWVGQGTFADRTQEHLGESDRGVILMRKRMLEEAEAVRRGGVPKGNVWDEGENRRVELPIIDRDFYVAGYSMTDVVEGRTRGPRYARSFVFQSGQPAEIATAYRAAMGIDRVEQTEQAARAANGAAH
jgi:5,5'-dehydrodivanillate O-demethylase